MRRTTKPLAALLLTLLMAGCRSTATTHYVHPNADLGAIRTVAVLPFENLTQERSASDKVQKIFTTELLALGVFDVVEPGQVAKLLRAEKIESTEALGPADMKKLGEALKAEGLFIGSVVDFADNRTGSTPAPEVTVQLRLIESQSGVTVWSVTRTQSGATTSARLFGIGGESLSEAARELVRKELRTLVK